MPALEDRLAELATHPPVDPTPVTEIQGRARRRVRRRRALVCSAAVLVVGLSGVGVGVAASSSTDPSEDVAVGGGDAPASTTSSTGSAPSTMGPGAADPGLVLVPATGFADGSTVTVTLDPPAAETVPVVLAQCDAAAAEVPDVETFDHCVGFVGGIVEGPQRYRLARTIAVEDGSIDCAASPGRCVLLARIGEPIGEPETSEDRFAPLTFAPGAGPVGGPSVDVDGDEGTVGDGDSLLVTLDQVETGDVVTVEQCVPATGRITDGEWQCDSSRGRTITVEDGPETQVTVTAYHDVFVNTADPGGWVPGWTACAPCELQVRTGDEPVPIARLPMTMEPTDAPIRPTVAVEPAGPHATGDRVTARATGLQPGSTATFAACVVVPPQGGGSSPCVYPSEGETVDVTVAADGTAVTEGFALPVTVQGEVCASVPGTCGIGLHAPSWFAYLAIAPLDLTP